MAQLELPYLWFAKGRPVRRYPYYRRGRQCIPLTSPDGRRLREGDTGIAEAYERLHGSFSTERRTAPYTGTVAHGIDEYRADGEYGQLKPTSKKSYDLSLNWLRNNHGHRYYADLTRETVLKLRREWKEKPTSANRLMKVLRILLDYVEDRPTTFLLPKRWENPMRRRIKRLKEGDGHWPWENYEIEQFRKTWKPGTIERALFEHLLNTGQRGSDIVRMSPKKYRDGEIHVAQTKTGEDVWIPVLDDHKPILDQWLASHQNEDFMFPNQGGGAMREGKMREIMHNAIEKAGLQTARRNLPIRRDDRTAHGLRYTFATRAVEYGIDYASIEAIVGHQTMAMAIKYTEKRRKSRATAAKLNARLKESREHELGEAQEASLTEFE